MSSVTTYPHITLDDKGTARIEGTRYKVLHLAAEHYHYGWSAEEMLRQHPDLRPEEVYAALTYFYDHRDDLVRQMQEQAETVERLRAGQSLSRIELLARKKEPH
jgi:uncharacterized protein (DUF433 family)